MRTLLASLCWVALVLVAAPKAMAQSDYGDLADRHRLQQSFPDAAAQPRPEPREAPSSARLPVLDISQILLLVLALAIAGTFAFFVIRNAIAYHRQNSQFATSAEADAAPVDVWGTVPDDSWEALLGRLRLSGDFNTAVHEMLLAAIGYCQKELAIHIPRAKTPREIRLSLPPDFAGTEAFETLVTSAELAWFGAKPVDRPMFQRGLDALEQILRLR